MTAFVGVLSLQITETNSADLSRKVMYWKRVRWFTEMSGKLQNRPEIQSRDSGGEASATIAVWVMMQPQPSMDATAFKQSQLTSLPLVMLDGRCSCCHQPLRCILEGSISLHVTSGWLHMDHVLDHPSCAGFWESEWLTCSTSLFPTKTLKWGTSPNHHGQPSQINRHSADTATS